MRILLIIDHLDPGGAQHQLVTLADGLVGRGHEVECFVYYPEMDHHRAVLDAAGVKVHGLQKASRFDLRVVTELRKIVKTGFDVALSYLTTPNIYNLVATISTDVTSIVSERSALLSGRIPFWTRARYTAYRLADRIVVNSGHQQERLSAEFPWMNDKLTTIRNGVDLERFHPAETSRERHDPEPSFVAVGSVHAGKNFIGLIEALRIHRERFDWAPRVRWIGRHGTRGVDVRAFKQADQLIRRYELRRHWEWLGVRRDVPELMREADALIHPSYFEGLPNVICEALATGLPVLAGRVCDHPWLVGEGDRGLLFDPSDPHDIALAIEQFSTLDKAEVRAMGLRAREFAERELSLETLVDQYETLFLETVAG